MPTKPKKKKKDYAPMVVFEAKTDAPTPIKVRIKKNNGFKTRGCNFYDVEKNVSPGDKPLAIFLVVFNGEIVGGIAAPPNSCFTVGKRAFGSTSRSSDKRAFGSEVSKSSEELLHLYNPCVRLPTGAWW